MPQPPLSPRRDCDVAGFVEGFEFCEEIGDRCGVAVDGDRAVADERRVDVTLTADGRALEDRAACIPERLLGSTHADPAQLAALRDALILITAEVYARTG